MSSHAVQLPLLLAPRDLLSPAYFVAHEGVRDVLEAIEHLCSDLRQRLAAEDELGFHFFFISGPPGSGKTHLARVMEERVREVSEEIPCRVFEFHGIDRCGEDSLATFIDTYQRLRGVGGVLAVFASQPPNDESWNPHLGSRFSCALPLTVDYPPDAELAPLVESVLERMNLRLPASEVEYLLRRVPSRPLSLTQIFDRISGLALAQGKPIGRGVFREVLAAPDGQLSAGGVLTGEAPIDDAGDDAAGDGAAREE